MLRFADWSVAVLGVLLIAWGVGCLWRARSKTTGHGSAEVEVRHRWEWGWSPLLAGLATVTGKVPHMLAAPFPVLMITDSLDMVLVITMAALAIRLLRVLRSGSHRVVVGPCDGDGR